MIVLPSALGAAQQVVVADVTYEHSAATTTDSHYTVEPLAATPEDLRSPIDYASGTAYVRLEVFTKPSDAATRFQVCFEGSPTYACTDQAPAYTATGLYTWATPFSRFYQGDRVDWSQGIRRIGLILKDTMNGKPAPENVGEEVSRRYMPTDVRVTVTLVAPGGTYVPPEGAAPTDAGAEEQDAGSIAQDAGPVGDAGMSDAGRTRDAGSAADAATMDADVSDAGDIRDEAVDGGCTVGPADRRRTEGAFLFAIAGLGAWLVRRRARAGRMGDPRAGR